MLSKSLVQFSVACRGCVRSLLFDLRPNYGGGNEDDGDLLHKVPCMHCHTHCPCSGESWTLTGKSGSVSCGVTAPSPGSWCTQGFVYALQESVSSVLCRFWWLYGRLMATSSKRAYATPRSAAPRSPTPVAGHCWPVPPQETLKHSKAGLAQFLWGLLVCTGFVWALWVSLEDMGFDSKCYFTPPTILLCFS